MCLQVNEWQESMKSSIEGLGREVQDVQRIVKYASPALCEVDTFICSMSTKKCGLTQICSRFFGLLHLRLEPSAVCRYNAGFLYLRIKFGSME